MSRIFAPTFVVVIAAALSGCAQHAHAPADASIAPVAEHGNENGNGHDHAHDGHNHKPGEACQLDQTPLEDAETELEKRVGG